MIPRLSAIVWWGRSPTQQTEYTPQDKVMRINETAVLTAAEVSRVANHRTSQTSRQVANVVWVVITDHLQCPVNYIRDAREFVALQWLVTIVKEREFWIENTFRDVIWQKQKKSWKLGSGPGSPFGLEDKAPWISWMFNFGGFTDSPHPRNQDTRSFDTIQATSLFPWWLLLFYWENL